MLKKLSSEERVKPHEWISRLNLYGRRILVLDVILLVTWLSVSTNVNIQQSELQWFLNTASCWFGFEIDKVVHFLMYFTLCFTLFFASPPRIWKLPAPLFAFVFSVFWGFLMEILQGIFTLLQLGTRRFDMADIFANVMGAATATLFLLIPTVTKSILEKTKT